MYRRSPLAKFLEKCSLLLLLFLFVLFIHVQAPEKQEVVLNAGKRLQDSLWTRKQLIDLIPPLLFNRLAGNTVDDTDPQPGPTTASTTTSTTTAGSQKTKEEEARKEAAFQKALAAERKIPYHQKIDKLMRGVLIPTENVTTPVPGAINLGLVMVNIPKTKNDTQFYRYGFAYKCGRTISQIMDRAGMTPLHYIIVTNKRSSVWAGRIVASVLCKRLTMDIIMERNYRWRKSKSVPPLYISLVDSDYMVGVNPSFNQGMRENMMETDKDDKYRSDFYYIAPNYHKAFTSLDRAVFIDATDLEFNIDIKELYDEFDKLDESTAIMSLGLDLAPHYFQFLTDYVRNNPNTSFGQPGRFQGFNTGVVLYRLDRMRESEVFNSYLTKEKVNYIMKMFGYHISLAEQDFLTLLGFLHPELFQILPCQFNRQESIQYNKPPFEAVFDAYHNCGTKEDVKIFHLNGCGPSIDQCGFQPGPDSKHYKNILNLFLHMDIEICWLTLKSFADGNWDWQDSIFTADGEKYKYLETVEGDMRRRRRRRKREDTNVRDDMAEGREVEGVKLGGDKEELSWKLVFQMEK